MFNESDLKLKLYSMLLEKYADLINSKEKRTIGEIKQLINLDDLTIQSLTAEFKPDEYLFENDFINSAKKAFDFISTEINYVKADLPISYWLSPKEIMAGKVADDEDLAVFFCSILEALGDKNCAVVIAELENQTTHAFTITELNNKFFIFDFAQKHKFDEFSGEKTNVLKKYEFDDAKIKRFLYKFNSKEYKQFL